MAKTVLKVEGMSCEHCVAAVKKAVGALSGVTAVSVDLNGKSVTVEHDPAADKAALTNAIEEQGYDVLA
ncbi:MAG: copper ion binding protein [Acidaminococcales bacterium]|jgi:copper chaperone|nr:copper ion binding protein [Acidaminococcales bacterium]